MAARSGGGTGPRFDHHSSPWSGFSAREPARQALCRSSGRTAPGPASRCRATDSPSPTLTATPPSACTTSKPASSVTSSPKKHGPSLRERRCAEKGPQRGALVGRLRLQFQHFLAAHQAISGSSSAACSHRRDAVCLELVGAAVMQRDRRRLALEQQARVGLAARARSRQPDRVQTGDLHARRSGRPGRAVPSRARRRPAAPAGASQWSIWLTGRPDTSASAPPNRSARARRREGSGRNADLVGPCGQFDQACRRSRRTGRSRGREGWVRSCRRR